MHLVFPIVKHCSCVMLTKSRALETLYASAITWDVFGGLFLALVLFIPSSGYSLGPLDTLLRQHEFSTQRT